MLTEELKKCDTLLLLVNVSDATYIIEASPGTGDGLLPKEDFPDCDAYVNWYATRYVGSGHTEALLEAADGGMHMYASADHPDWTELLEDIVLYDFLNRSESEENDDVKIVVLGGMK